ncbi:hypothetical protein RHSIM_Rhsim03G0086700 [Rhododendron simsii]|uniref:Uncharacterized protein n=1 Tax=Rhododendron simsii TaxID=118357 RepID=A0A834H2Q7_RHOSS|nr:hypothetical protein RHSIM_Rhsim03G0086700 [Rhododendron simsii]
MCSNRKMKERLCVDLELNQFLDHNAGDISDGELQRFTIAVVAIQNEERYMFDEPASYLDVKQRLKAAQCQTASIVLWSNWQNVPAYLLKLDVLEDSDLEIPEFNVSY